MPSKQRRRKKPKKIPYRNLSPHGWWIASYIERPVWDDEKPTLRSRCMAWENTIILKAKDRDAAYKKALQKAKADNRSKFWHTKTKRPGHWVFVGLTSLLPIYEPLEDGAEVLWHEYEDITLRRVLAKTKRKRELECFDDTLAIGDLPGP